jgi:hypothetical protein
MSIRLMAARAVVSLAALVLPAALAGCSQGRSLLDAADGGSADSAAVAAVCGGFTMPNPPKAGLPNPASYTDNGDGTVTDDVTGLVWQNAVSQPGSVNSDAAAACAARGAGWRLPTRLELVSLVDFTIAAPGPTINAMFANTPSAVFWTSSPYYGNVGDAWTVGFDGGYSDYSVLNNPDLVRCVRAPTPTCHDAHYVDQAGGLVLDETTGLTWQKNLDPGSYTWSDAGAYCTGLGAGWRVPSLTELQTIVDDAKEYPAADLDVFPGTPHDDFWTSSANADGTGSAWYIDFFYGATDSDVPTRTFRVRCVR